MQRRLLLCGYALFCLVCLWLSVTLQEVQAETWEEAAIRLEREDRQEKVDAAKKAIIDGTLEPFTGPLYDQEGNKKVEDGVKMTDDEIWNMNWFVKGVTGTIPA